MEKEAAISHFRARVRNVCKQLALSATLLEFSYVAYELQNDKEDSIDESEVKIVLTTLDLANSKISSIKFLLQHISMEESTSTVLQQYLEECDALDGWLVVLLYNSNTSIFEYFSYLGVASQEVLSQLYIHSELIQTNPVFCPVSFLDVAKNINAKNFLQVLVTSDTIKSTLSCISKAYTKLVESESSSASELKDTFVEFSLGIDSVVDLPVIDNILLQQVQMASDIISKFRSLGSDENEDTHLLYSYTILVSNLAISTSVLSDNDDTFESSIDKMAYQQLVLFKNAQSRTLNLPLLQIHKINIRLQYHLRKLINASQRAGDVYQICDKAHELSILLRRTPPPAGDVNKSLEVIDFAIENAAELPDDIRAGLFNSRGISMRYAERFEESLVSYRMARDLTNYHENLGKFLLYLLNIGVCIAETELIDESKNRAEAEQALDQVLRAFEARPDQVEQYVNATFMQARILYYKGAGKRSYVLNLLERALDYIVSQKHLKQSELANKVLSIALHWINRDPSSAARHEILDWLHRYQSIVNEATISKYETAIERILMGDYSQPEVSLMDENSIDRINIWTMLHAGLRIRLIEAVLGEDEDFVYANSDVLLNPIVLNEIEAFVLNTSSDNENQIALSLEYLQEIIKKRNREAFAQTDEVATKSDKVALNKGRISSILHNMQEIFIERKWSRTIQLLRERNFLQIEMVKSLNQIGDIFKLDEPLGEGACALYSHAKLIELICNFGEEQIQEFFSEGDLKFSVNGAAQRIVLLNSWQQADIVLQLHPHLMQKSCLKLLRQEVSEYHNDNSVWHDALAFIEWRRNHKDDNLGNFIDEYNKKKNIQLNRLLNAESTSDLLKLAQSTPTNKRHNVEQRIEAGLSSELRTNFVSRSLIIASVLYNLRNSEWISETSSTLNPSMSDLIELRDIKKFAARFELSAKGEELVHNMEQEAFRSIVIIINFVLETFPEDAKNSSCFLETVQIVRDRVAIENYGYTIPAFYITENQEAQRVIGNVMKEYDADEVSNQQLGARIDMLLCQPNISANLSLKVPLKIYLAKCLFDEGLAPGWKRYKAASVLGALLLEDLSDVVNDEMVTSIKAEYLMMLVTLPGMEGEVFSNAVCSLTLNILEQKASLSPQRLAMVTVAGLDGVNLQMQLAAKAQINGLDYGINPLETMNVMWQKTLERSTVQSPELSWAQAKIQWIIAGFDVQSRPEEFDTNLAQMCETLSTSFDAAADTLKPEDISTFAWSLYQINLAQYRTTISYQNYKAPFAHAIIESVLRRLHTLRSDERWKDVILAAKIDRLIALATIRDVRDPDKCDFHHATEYMLTGWQLLGTDFDPEAACHELSIIAQTLIRECEFEMADKVHARLFEVLPFLVQYSTSSTRQSNVHNRISKCSREWAFVKFHLNRSQEAIAVLAASRAQLLRERLTMTRNSRNQSDIDLYREAIATLDSSLEKLLDADESKFLAPELSIIATAKEQMHTARWRLSASNPLVLNQFSWEQLSVERPIIVLFAAEDQPILIVGASKLHEGDEVQRQWKAKDLGKICSENEIIMGISGERGWLKSHAHSTNPQAVLTELSRMLLPSILELLESLCIPKGTTLSYCGYGIFSAMPISALGDHETLGDLYPIEIVGVYDDTSKDIQSNTLDAHASITVFDDPSEDLAAGALDLEILQNHGFTQDSFAGSEASRQRFTNALKESHRIHFSGHSVFDAQNVSSSYLLLANNERILASELMLMIQHGKVREVFLSSCAAGVIGDGVTDEYEGLATSMLVAGAETVISALWPVNQIPTALLSLYYYQAQRDEGLSPATALASAQTRLRRTTTKQAEALLKSSQYSNALGLGQLKGIQARDLSSVSTLQSQKSDNFAEQPFADSKHWAGFYCLKLA